MKKIFAVLSPEKDFTGNEKAINFAIALGKRQKSENFLKLTAICPSDRTGIVPYALAAGLDDGICLDLTHDGGLYGSLALSSLIIRKCGMADIIISPYGGVESRAMSAFLGTNTIRISNHAEAASFAENSGKNTEKSLIFFSDDYISEGKVSFGMSAIRHAASKPYYLWNENDIGEDIDSFLAENSIFFKDFIEKDSVSKK